MGSKETPNETPLDPEEAKGQQQSEGENSVDTNAGEDAKQGTIAESSDQPTKAGE